MRWIRSRRLRKLQKGARSDGGFTLFELMMAVTLVSFGLLSLVGTLSFTRKLTDQSEVKEAAVHRAQRELERVAQLDFETIAHPSSTSFTAADNSRDPTSRIVAGAPPRFKYDRKDAAKSATFVTAGNGKVELGPTDWEDGRFSGTVHRFVTDADDAACAGLLNSPLCPNSRNYKRVTVVVTIRGLGDPLEPVWFSSMVSDPRDGPVDAVTSPVTECLDGSGQLSECVNGVADSVRSLFPTDTAATNSTRQSILGNHATHPTIAPFGVCTLLVIVGCPTPDLLENDPPPASGVVPQLYKYSTDVSGGYNGGRALRRDTTCSGTPSSSDNTKGGFWATPAVSSAMTLTGDGAMSLYTHTIDGVAANVTLCMAFYEVPSSILNLLASPPTEIGRTSYSLSSWPRKATRLTFPFEFRTSNVSLSSGKRLGVRIWVSSSSGADIAIIYDHPSYPTQIQVHEPGTSAS